MGPTVTLDPDGRDHLDLDLNTVARKNTDGVREAQGCASTDHPLETTPPSAEKYDHALFPLKHESI